MDEAPYLIQERLKAAELNDLAESYRQKISQALDPTLAAYRDHLVKTGSLDREFVPDTSREFYSLTAELLALSFLSGIDHANPKTELADSTLSFAPSVGEVGFPEAVDFLRSRIPMSKAQWKDLDAQLRFRAFTVARLTQFRAIDDIKEKLARSVEAGGTLGQFLKDEDFQALTGFETGDTRYWELVFRNNMQGAYNAGRAKQFTDLQPGYLEFVGLDDERQTDICHERSGTVLPASDSWWEANWPGLHHGCRSTVRAVPDPEAKRRGLADRSTLETLPGVKRGFGANPVSTGSFWRMTPEMVSRAEEYGVTKQIRSFARDLGIKEFRMSNPAYTSPEDGQRVTKGMSFDLSFPGVGEAAPVVAAYKVLALRKDYLGNEVFVTDRGLAHRPERLQEWGGPKAFYSLFERAIRNPDNLIYDAKRKVFLYGLKDPSKKRPYLWFEVGAESGRFLTVQDKGAPFDKMGTRYILKKGTL